MWLGTIYSTLVKFIVCFEIGLVVLKPQKLPAWSSKVCHSDRKSRWDLRMSNMRKKKAGKWPQNPVEGRW